MACGPQLEGSKQIQNIEMLYSTKSASVLMGKSLNFFLGWVRARARAFDRF